MPYLVPEVDRNSVTKVREGLYMMPPVHGDVEHVTWAHYCLHPLQLLQARELLHVWIIKINLWIGGNLASQFSQIYLITITKTVDHQMLLK